MIFLNLDIGREELQFIPGDDTKMEGTKEILSRELISPGESLDFHYVRENLFEGRFRFRGFVFFLVGTVRKIEPPVDALA